MNQKTSTKSEGNPQKRGKHPKTPVLNSFTAKGTKKNFTKGEQNHLTVGNTQRNLYVILILSGTTKTSIKVKKPSKRGKHPRKSVLYYFSVKGTKKSPQKVKKTSKKWETPKEICTEFFHCQMKQKTSTKANKNHLKGGNAQRNLY